MSIVRSKKSIGEMLRFCPMYVPYSLLNMVAQAAELGL